MMRLGLLFLLGVFACAFSAPARAQLGTIGQVYSFLSRLVYLGMKM
jgi:hypothetical protein